MKKLTTQRGFTLVELLVVIAIIGVLAGILVPTIARARRRAAATSCLNNLRQIGISLSSYGDDHRFYPIDSDLRGGGSRDCTNVGQAWKFLVQGKYIDDPAVFICSASDKFEAVAPDTNQDFRDFDLQDSEVSYTYVKRVRVSGKVKSTTVISSDEAYGDGEDTNHIDGLNVLYGTSTVKWLDDNKETEQKIDDRIRGRVIPDGSPTYQGDP